LPNKKLVWNGGLHTKKFGRKTHNNHMTEEELEDMKKMFENPQKIYVSQEDYDKLVEQLNLPSEATIESVKRLMQRKSPFTNEQ